MRALLRLLALSLLLGVGGTALAQEAEAVPVGPPPKEPIARFKGPMDERPKDTGIGLRGFAVLVGAGSVIFVVMLVWYRRTTQDLGMELGDDEEGFEGVPGAAAAAEPVREKSGPKESIMAVLGRAGGWVTPGRIALGAGLDIPVVEEHLEDLIREGRAKAGRDKSGRVLYRTTA